MIDRAKIFPPLLEKIDRLQKIMDLLGHPMALAAGARTAEEQHLLWRQGRDLPGQVVTNADGYKKPSNHQIKADGFGHAVDMAFLDENGHLSWAEKYPWQLYGTIGKALGLSWGGDWKDPVDRPHFELLS